MVSLGTGCRMRSLPEFTEYSCFGANVPLPLHLTLASRQIKNVELSRPFVRDPHAWGQVQGHGSQQLPLHSCWLWALAGLFQVHWVFLASLQSFQKCFELFKDKRPLAALVPKAFSLQPSASLAGVGWLLVGKASGVCRLKFLVIHNHHSFKSKTFEENSALFFFW